MNVLRMSYSVTSTEIEFGLAISRKAYFSNIGNVTSFQACIMEVNNFDL